MTLLFQPLSLIMPRKPNLVRRRLFFDIPKSFFPLARSSYHGTDFDFLEAGREEGICMALRGEGGAGDTGGGCWKVK